MQNTRLNSLVDIVTTRLNRWLTNPWRRLSLQVIGLLFGFFLGSAISTIAGQAAKWDVVAAAAVVVTTEVVNWLVYRRSETMARSLVLDSINAIKIGIIYSLFLEAFKLGS